MTLTLNLPPEVKGALAQEAQRPMLALFAEWDAEDETDDPEEIARRQKEGDELMAALKANRFNLEGRTDFRALLGEDGEGGPQEKAS